MSDPPQQARLVGETVYCHQCTAEWNRAQHGLVCPRCQSEFTEVLESESQYSPTDTSSTITPRPAAADRAQHSEADWEDVPDPGEEDISAVSSAVSAWSPAPGNHNLPSPIWTTNTHSPFSPPAMSFAFLGRHPHTDDRGRNTGQTERDPTSPFSPDLIPMMHAFHSMIHSIMGAASPGPSAAPTPTSASNALSPSSTRSRSLPPGASMTTRTGGGPGITWRITTSRVPASDMDLANPIQVDRESSDASPQTPGSPSLQRLPGLLRLIFAGPPVVAGPAQVQFHPMDPFAMFAGLADPANMRHGDAVFSNEALDRVMSQLMEQNSSGSAPGPASTKAITSLPTRAITAEDLGPEDRAECSICMEEVKHAEQVTVLPCHHWFHGDCVKAWLGEHDTCPHCRQSIMCKRDENTSEADADRLRTPLEPPRHDHTLGSPLPSGEPNYDADWPLPNSPLQFGRPSADRRQSRSVEPLSSRGSVDNSPGGDSLFSRMRNAFGAGVSDQNDGGRRA